MRLTKKIPSLATVTLGVLAAIATPRTIFAQACESRCESCGVANQKQFIDVEEYNSQQPPSYNCIFALSCYSCDAFASAETRGKNGAHRASTVEALLANVVSAARSNSAAVVKLLLMSEPRVTYNAGRRSIQVFGCNNSSIVANAPLRPDIARDIARYVASVEPLGSLFGSLVAARSSWQQNVVRGSSGGP